MQVVLASQLSRWLDASGAMLLLTDWPIYTPEEMDLFLDARSRFGPARQRLIDTPCHHFDEDRKQATTALAVLLFLMMAFNWEGYLLPASGEAIVWLADEIIETATQSIEQDLVMQRALEALHVEDVRAAKPEPSG